MAEIIVPSTIESLDDELFVHVLEQVVSSPKSLGACRAVSLRWRDLSMDDVLWRQVCAGQFGLNQVRAPPNSKAPCTNFYQAARAWFAYRKEFGLRGVPLPDDFADTVTAAHGHWAKLSAWAAVHLPEAKASIGAPASAADWTAFLEWLDLGSTAYAVSTFPGLLQLRVLSSVCNGQQLASDAKMAARHISQSASVEGIEQALEQLALTNGHGGQLSREQSIRESFQGLLGGLSAYDTSLCMRLFPLVVAAAWTQYFRKEQGLPDKLVIAGGSYNLQRLLVVDIETGALLSGPSQSILPDREGVPLTPGQRIYLMRAVPASRASACDLITFMGEHARRVEAGYHLCEPLVPLEPATRGLCLFPQAGPKFSEATTRGVRVTASAVFCAELGERPPCWTAVLDRRAGPPCWTAVLAGSSLVSACCLLRIRRPPSHKFRPPPPVMPVMQACTCTRSDLRCSRRRRRAV